MTEETNSRTGFYASFPRVYEAEQGQYIEYGDYARLKAEVDAIRKELAEAQENYHLVNEMVAKMLKSGKSIE
jgi:hypothetical protein